MSHDDELADAFMDLLTRRSAAAREPEVSVHDVLLGTITWDEYHASA
jgi:hypothetical protein